MLVKESAIEQTNTLLGRVSVGAQPPVICLLTGSSGCGKTHLSKALASELDPNRSEVFYFDSVGVPSPAAMVRDFGSGERWQEVTTHKWVERMAAVRDKGLVVLEGQFHPRFALEACRASGLKDFVLAVVTCDEQTWISRLHGPRGQPELVTADMRNWSRVLREETVKAGGAVIDTSDSNVERNLSEVGKLVNSLLRARIMG